VKSTDTEAAVTGLKEKAAIFRQRFPEIPDGAAMCVYFPFVETAGLAIANGRQMPFVAEFPGSQAIAGRDGGRPQSTDGGDITLNLDQFMAEKGVEAGEDIRILRETAEEDMSVKVIAETGLLKTLGLIRRALLLVMLGRRRCHHNLDGNTRGFRHTSWHILHDCGDPR
jgi:deoxyribose-phosphate aldolase